MALHYASLRENFLFSPVFEKRHESLKVGRKKSAIL
jgi:hypothetical protein